MRAQLPSVFRIVTVVAALAACLGLAAPAHAATFTVTNTADSGLGSLRQAVLDSNASPGPDVITFSLPGCPCVIPLTSTLAIADILTIAGPGASALALQGNGSFPILTSNFSTLDVSDLTIRGGGGSINGGGITAQQALTLTRVRLENNTAGQLGGGAFTFGQLTLIDSTVSGNVAGNGAGVASGSTVFVQGGNNAFTNNHANTNGGAILASTVSLAGATFTGNTAASRGGAVHASGLLDIAGDVTFDGNTAAIEGGAVYALSAVTLNGATFKNNQAGGGGAVASNAAQNLIVNGGLFQANSSIGASGGGAILLAGGGSANITGATFTQNSSLNGGGGAVRGGGGPGIIVIGSTFTQNQSQREGGAIAQAGGALVADRSVFKGNEGGAFSSNDGGAIAVSGISTALVTNSLFTGNLATTLRGTAMYFGSSTTATVTHATIANAGLQLAGSAIESAGALEVRNTIVADSAFGVAATSSSSRTIPVSGFLAWNVTFPTSATNLATITVTGQVLANPVFVSPANGDYHLGAGSAAVDAAPAGVTSSDFDGDSRPQGAGHDLGFDERPLTAQTITFGAIAGRTLGTAPFSVTVSASSGLAVVLTSQTPAICTVAGLTVTLVAAGTCTIDANQSGNAYYLAATKVTQGFQVTQPLFQLTVTKSGGGGGTVTSSPAGIDCGATCSASFNSGATVTLTPAATLGSFFNGWTGACTGTGACSVTMDAAKAVNAEFKLNTTIPRLANISTRMQVLTGNDVLIGGFIIGGSTPKTVVVRARGPSLIPFGITNALANPMMQLFSGQTVIATSDDFGTAANLAALNASGFAPSSGTESAILTTLGPGAYTAVVSGVGGTTGVGIIEVFEVDHPETPLANISTRGQVLTGGDVMIGGFVIQGDAPQTVIVRARGPSLIPFGITNALQDPVLQLFSGQTVIATSDDWQSSPDAANITTRGFAPSDAKESVILITLPPGAYTAIVSGKNGGTGVGIIEVFAQ